MPDADLVITGPARARTGRTDDVAVRAGRIVALGSDVADLVGRRTRVVPGGLVLLASRTPTCAPRSAGDSS